MKTLEELDDEFKKMKMILIFYYDFFNRVNKVEDIDLEIVFLLTGEINLKLYELVNDNKISDASFLLERGINLISKYFDKKFYDEIIEVIVLFNVMSGSDEQLLEMYEKTSETVDDELLKEAKKIEKILGMMRKEK